jgi:bacterioferritin-associated ferredoxin
VDKAVDFATEAFETGLWSEFTGVQRGKCLNKLADFIEEHGEELAYLESIASGRPVSMMNWLIYRDQPTFGDVSINPRRKRKVLMKIEKIMLGGQINLKEIHSLRMMGSTR